MKDQAKAVARNSITDFRPLEPAQEIAKQTVIVIGGNRVRRWNTIVKEISRGVALGLFICNVSVDDEEKQKLEALGYRVEYPEDSKQNYGFIRWDHQLNI